MSTRKSRREIDKAVGHLMVYSGPNDEWDGRLEEVKQEMFAPLADKLDLDVDELSDVLFTSPNGHMAYGFVFEEYATVRWNNEPLSLIGAYLKQRGWREGAAGRRYLQALDESELVLWEVTAVKPGAHVDVRPYGTQKKSIRVKEKAASETLRQWDGLAARVLQLEGKNGFSGALLALSPDNASRILAMVETVGEQLHEMMQALVKDGNIEALPDDIEDAIRDEKFTEFANVVFTIWAMDAYLYQSSPRPQMRNMDDEDIELIQLRFPLKGDPAKVQKALNAHACLDLDGDDTRRWIWLPEPAGDIQEGVPVHIHGHVTLAETSVQLEVNSEQRAERGRALLSSLLGELVGSPLAAYQNLEQLDPSSIEPLSSAALPPEAQAAMEAHLTNHYRQTLDESIPMLHGKTPRECAADPALKGDVITWLKQLENSAMHDDQLAFDFTWMWNELNLVRD